MKRLTALLTFSIVSLLAIAPAGASSHRFWAPVLAMSKQARERIACILWRESRSTFARLNLADVSRWGSSGLWQMEPILFNRWAPLVGVHVPVWKATPYQQELVFVEVVKYDGFSPWNDGC